MREKPLGGGIFPLSPKQSPFWPDICWCRTVGPSAPASLVPTLVDTLYYISPANTGQGYRHWKVENKINKPQISGYLLVRASPSNTWSEIVCEIEYLVIEKLSIFTLTSG